MRKETAIHCAMWPPLNQWVFWLLAWLSSLLLWDIVQENLANFSDFLGRSNGLGCCYCADRFQSTVLPFNPRFHWTSLIQLVNSFYHLLGDICSEGPIDQNALRKIIRNVSFEEGANATNELSTSTCTNAKHCSSCSFSGKVKQRKKQKPVKNGLILTYIGLIMSKSHLHL